MESQTSKPTYSAVATQPIDDEEWGVEHAVLASAQPVGNQSGTDILPELKNHDWADDYFQDDNHVIAVFDHDFEWIQKEYTIVGRILCFVILVLMIVGWFVMTDHADNPMSTNASDTPDDVDGHGHNTDSLLFWIHASVILFFMCCCSCICGSWCANDMPKPHTALTSEGVLYSEASSFAKDLRYFFPFNDIVDVSTEGRDPGSRVGYVAIHTVNDFRNYSKDASNMASGTQATFLQGPTIKYKTLEGLKDPVLLKKAILSLKEQPLNAATANPAAACVNVSSVEMVVTRVVNDDQEAVSILREIRDQLA